MVFGGRRQFPFSPSNKLSVTALGSCREARAKRPAFTNQATPPLAVQSGVRSCYERGGGAVRGILPAMQSVMNRWCVPKKADSLPPWDDPSPAPLCSESRSHSS